MKIEIDSDITKARTIPSKFYHSKKVYRKLKKLFDRSWQFIGDTELEKNNSTGAQTLIDAGLNAS